MVESMSMVIIPLVNCCAGDKMLKKHLTSLDNQEVMTEVEKHRQHESHLYIIVGVLPIPIV